MSYNFFTEKKKNRYFPLLSPPEENKGTSEILQIIFTLVPVEKEYANKENHWNDQKPNSFDGSSLSFLSFVQENIAASRRMYGSLQTRSIWTRMTRFHKNT